MRHSLFIGLVTVFVAAPALAEPDTVDVRVKTKAKVRHEWAARFQDSRQGPEVTERFHRNVRLGATGSFELSNVSGDVTVTGGGGDQVRIEAVKRVRSRHQENAKALLDELRIEVSELPTRVEVRTVYPQNRRNYSGSVDYTIALPSGASASVKTVSGNVRVTNVKGELRAESVSGNVTTSGAGRLALAKSISGDVDVTDAASDSAVEVSTVSGNVTARGLKARSLDLSSVSGNVLVSNVTSERAMAKSVSGNIEYSGPLARAGRYEMNAHSGDVRLAVSNTSGFELDATTFSGEVRSDFPLTLRAGMDSGKGRRMNRSIRGSYGDAGAIVNLKSFSGNIVVTKQ